MCRSCWPQRTESKRCGTPTAFSQPEERTAYGALLAGTVAVAGGSAYYHLHPDNTHLFWDRLPMTVVFMALLTAVIGERVSMPAGRTLLFPMALLGGGTVFYWRFTGDLRTYAIVQFGCMLALPFLLLRYPPRYTHANGVWWTVLFYRAAKILELTDHVIAPVLATGGHPWKHVAAAAAIFVYANAVARRRPLLAAC